MAPVTRRSAALPVACVLLLAGMLSTWRLGRAFVGSARNAGRVNFGLLRYAGSTQGVLEDVSTWRPSEMRRYLDERGIRHNDCFEKSELIARVEETVARNLPPKAAQDPQPSAATASATDPLREAAGRFANFGELVELPSAQKEDGVFIFLHGFGDSGRGFVSQLPNLLSLPSVRYVLPTAPSLSGMRSWFTTAAMMGGASVGGEAVRESIEYVHVLIRREIARGIPSEKIFVGGFSQGGCIAVQAALSFPDAPLGGCVAASTFLSLGGGPQSVQVAAINRRLPVLGVHGEADGAVPLSSGQSLVDTLRQQGIQAEFRSYPGMGHAYCPEEARDVSGFVARCLRTAVRPDELARMSAKELKALLLDAGISVVGCFEKSELLERARETLL